MELRKIDKTNIWEIVKLSVREDQRDFVASNTESILEAYAAVSRGDFAMPFGLYENGAAVGFVMFGYDVIDEDDPPSAKENYSIWRLMIDKEQQGHGLGRKAFAAALAYIRTMPCGRAESCWLSYEPENIAAAALYSRFGFSENGEKCGDETVAVLKL